MSDPVDFAWMRRVLQSLFDDTSREVALDAIRSVDRFAELSARLRATVDGIPAGDYGDNLVMAMLALRVKFPYDEAAAKLEVNIAMRSERTGTSRR